MVVSLLLCLALVCTVFAASGTVQAYQQFQREHQQIDGDVSTVSGWMTLPYIARVYKVPEACLAHTLHFTQPILSKHATLSMVANDTKKPVDTVIRNVRDFIVAFRKHQPICGNESPPKTPTPQRSPTVKQVTENI